MDNGAKIRQFASFALHDPKVVYNVGCNLECEETVYWQKQFGRVILKLSGEALGVRGSLFDHEAFEAAARMLMSVAKSGVELAVVIGGGNIWRGRRGAATRMGAVAADQMGMLATFQNCLYMPRPPSCGWERRQPS